MPEIEIELYEPHQGQQRIQDQARRFNVIPCARRFGKTELMISVEMPLLSPAIFYGKKVGVFVDNQKDFKESWNGIVARYGMFKQGGLITHKNETESLRRSSPLAWANPSRPALCQPAPVREYDQRLSELGQLP